MRSTAFPGVESLAVGEKMTFKVFSDSARMRKIPFGPVYTWQALNRPQYLSDIIFETLPPVADFDEGQEVRVWRGSGANKKP